jgi:adenylate cyclase
MGSEGRAGYRFDRFTLDLIRGALRADDGSELALRPKSFDLLRYMVINAGRLIDRDELMQAVWPGVFVTDENITQCVKDIRRALDDQTQRVLRTVPRRGYLLDVSTSCLAAAESGALSPASTNADAAASLPAPPPNRPLVRSDVPGEPSARLALPDKPSIAVLPFDNMSDDTQQEYFVDGMVEDIITGLSRIKWLFVIARNSSFIYRGKAVDIRQVGRELGVRYVLEGGVRKAGSRLRITAQLIEAENGAHLWADRYDGMLEDVFDLQDQITDRVVAVVEPRIRQSEIERSRRKHPESLDAYDLCLRALPHLNSVMPADATIAAGFLNEALKLDPNYVLAHAHLAHCHEIFFMRGGFDEADKIAGLRHARSVIASGTDDATALAIAGMVISNLSMNRKEALSAIERALSFNPVSATALFFGALTHAFAGDPAAATDYANRALRLSPFDPMVFVAHVALGFAALQEARYDEAALSYAKAAQANPRFSSLYFNQAVALALAGRIEEARPIVQLGLELEPGARSTAIYDYGVTRAIADKWIEGARLLGLPE